MKRNIYIYKILAKKGKKFIKELIQNDEQFSNILKLYLDLGYQCQVEKIYRVVSVDV